MTQRTDGQLVKLTVRLWQHDVDFLKARYSDNYNAQIRRVVGHWIIKERKRLEANNATQTEA